MIRRSLVSVALGLTVAVMGSLVQLPAAAVEPGVAAPLPGEEIVAARTRVSKSFATETPGVLRTELYAGPIHYRAADGVMAADRLAPGAGRGWATAHGRL